MHQFLSLLARVYVNVALLAPKYTNNSEYRPSPDIQRSPIPESLERDYLGWGFDRVTQEGLKPSTFRTGI